MGVKLFVDKRYICEIHRDLYDWINMQPNLIDREKGISLVDEAFHSGKRMSDWMKRKNTEAKKKMLIIDYPWGKTWLPLYIKAINKRGYAFSVWDGISEFNGEDPDVVLCTWADRDFTSKFPNARHFMMMRRFELFHSPWRTWNWEKIQRVICCNPWIAAEMAEVIGKEKPIYIPNPLDTSLWRFEERTHGVRIGMACRLHPVKNLPLAAQILMALPANYELHIIGKVDDSSIWAYMKNVLWGKRLKFHEPVPNGKMDFWWDKMHYCLSTSISEGDPMNVLEAMAKGIKPIIHNWPGAMNIFGNSMVFDTVPQAVEMICGDSPYDSKEYRDFVVSENSPELADRVAELIDGV
jgi:hypothetical protein